MGLGDLVQKAFYLGVGLASYAGEKAGGTLSDLRGQAQKLVEEMVARGEMTTEEARKVVEELMNQAQQQPPIKSTADATQDGPRKIDILIESNSTPGDTPATADPDKLRQQVQALQEQLNQLRRES
jgi:polyhydroxyalkanoate synthesis regulator phasin